VVRALQLPVPGLHFRSTAGPEVKRLAVAAAACDLLFHSHGFCWKYVTFANPTLKYEMDTFCTSSDNP
jgi:hypothetical protein